MQIEAVQEQYSTQSVTESALQNNIKGLSQNAEKRESVGKTEDSRKQGDGFTESCPHCQCEKCRTRRYQDISNDSRVSFQMPSKMDPVKARSRVKSHEMEHVRNEQHKAAREGKKVVSQSVRIMTDRCEECGTSYVKGGFTRTITRPDFTDFRRVITGTLKKDDDKRLIGIA